METTISGGDTHTSQLHREKKCYLMIILLKFSINSVKMRVFRISKRFEYHCRHLAFCSLFLFRKVLNITAAILLFALFFYFENFRISLSPSCFSLSFSISKSFEFQCRHLAFGSLFLFRKVSNITALSYH